MNVTVTLLRRLPLSIHPVNAAHWHSPLLPGAGCWTGHPTGQHRSVEVHLPQACRDRLLQLRGKENYVFKLCCLVFVCFFWLLCKSDSVAVGSSLGVFLCGALLQRDPVVESLLPRELIPVPSTVGAVPKAGEYYRYLQRRLFWAH